MKVVTDTFNSDIFGMKMGNIIDIPSHCTASDIHQLIEKARREQYKHLNVKVNVSDKVHTNMFLAKGFELVDTQLMYCIDTEQHYSHKDTKETVRFRGYQAEDKAQIINIAKSAYVIDQYHSDSKLDNTLCDIYYSEWAKNCCEGLADKVLVAVVSDHKVVGYLTLNYRADTAVVGLAAVDRQFRGRGLFTFLLRNTLEMLCREKIQYLLYGTQLSNTPVLKAMGHLGGTIDHSNHVMHLML